MCIYHKPDLDTPIPTIPFGQIYKATRSLNSSGTGLLILRPRQNGRHFADDIFKCIFLNENVWIPIKISLKFVLKGRINNIPALVQIMAWPRPGDEPLSEPVMVNLPTHKCVTPPQWVNSLVLGRFQRYFQISNFPANFGHWWLMYLFWNSPPMNDTVPYSW